jgi:ankyrin repeat protein
VRKKVPPLQLRMESLSSFGARDEFGRTPLLAAIQSGDVGGLQSLLLSAPIQPNELNAADSLGRTIWHWLAGMTGISRAKVLSLVSSALEGKGNSLGSCLTKSNESPLHWLVGDISARKLCPEDVMIAKLFVAAKVDPTLRSATGESASDLVRKRMELGRDDNEVCANMLEALAAAPALSTSSPAKADAGASAPAAGSFPIAVAPTMAIAGSGAAGAGAGAKKKTITVKLKK